MTDILPTHSCFDDAMDFFELFDLEHSEVRREMLRKLRLVHGICVSSENVRYAHAWVEEHIGNDAARADWPQYVVWQGMSHKGRRAYFAVDRVWFYAAYQVESNTSYSIQQFAALNLASGHYGPWAPQYVELVKQHGRKILGRVQGAVPLGIVFAEATEA